MRKTRHILFFAACLLLACLPASARAQEGNGEIDATAIIFEHVADSYSWHIATWGDKNITLPLPVILYDRESGWHACLSSRFANGAHYAGFHIGDAGKIVRDTDGTRPLDLSVTKTVFALILNALLLVLLVLSCASRYRRPDAWRQPPHGLSALLEPLVVLVNDEIAKPAVGEDWKRYSPYLLTVFFFILLNNLTGIIPFFPGGANVTGNIAVTATLAAGTFLAVNLTGSKHYWKEILWPDVPVFLKAVPLMPVIEIVGLLTKPFSLAIRLFANIFAGHAMLIGVICVIFVTAKMGAAISGSMTLVAVVLGVFMDCLELLVAFIQAYVFTMLSAVFIGISRQKE